ncbi:MAG: DNA polymerase, partial [Candidatus Methanoperedens sp.]|nr:DNA polymerase [Candidatus Methanoperedens sp.]
KGYTETLFGRVRYLPEINSSVLQVAKAAERMAINTPLQGTAADMIKIAMIKIYRWLHSGDSPVEPRCERLSAACNIAPQPFGIMEPSVKMLLQVHDELLFEVKENMVDEAAEKIKDIMENVIKLKVPVIVDAKVGDNWGEMKKI